MSSRFSEESAAGDAWQEKYEQLQVRVALAFPNELALAQYEAQKWKEKYVVEKRRRQKTARDLLDLVVHEESVLIVASHVYCHLNSADHTGNLLSPTLSSFDFDDDSSEEDDEEDDDQKAPGPPPPLVAATRHESAAEDASALDGGPMTMPFNPSIALDLRDRQSLMYHLNATATRPNRSSTTGSALEAVGGSSHRMMDGKNGAENGYTPPPQNLMYRIMYAKPSSRDLWHSRAHPNKLQNVARSIMFSMHLKKEHIFERFFVAGMTLGEPERQQATQTAGLAGFWKPKVLYEFPHRINGTPDESVADFCFPRGVPLVVCRPDQATALQDAVVSKWFTEVEPLQKHVNQASQTSGYTFRLTGAKGEVLYGFCVAVMKEVLMTGVSQGTSGTPKSPHNNWASSWLSSSKEGNSTSSKNMAPVCYCFTSKFPFYRFHFALLRMIIENEMEQQALRSTTGQGGEPIEDEQFEIILRPLLNLAVEFTLYHEENARMRDQSSESETGDQRGLNSIASKMCVASPSDRRVVLSEDASVAGNSGSDSQLNVEKRKRPSQLRKSLSTDDISTYSFATGWIVDKPMVKRTEASQPKEYERVRVGDVLEAVDNIATGTTT
ncbi:hypothetical protein BBJ28_00019019 [Nothophytophthora sp. Chile5]|nr:hypothetical protein BBJ28_00019019 [Nothophytophthora sp. Chile5]